MIPRVALGSGFFGSKRPKVSDAVVHPVDVSNGMPVISQKRALLEKAVSAVRSSKSINVGPNSKGVTSKVA